MYPWECVVAGSIAGCAGVIVCHPLDVVRTHMQTSSYNLRSSGATATTMEVSGVVSTFRSIWQNQGVTGFYRGITGPFLAQACYKSLIFTTNSIVQAELVRRRIAYTTPENTPSSINWAVFLSGLVAGSVNAFVVAPVEMIRTHQILSGTSFLVSFRSFLWDGSTHHTHNYATLGRSGTTSSISNSTLRWLLLWRGLVPTILRDGPGVGLYFLTFESTKEVLHNCYRNTSRLHQQTDQSQRQQPIWCTLLAGSLAGIAFWVWALPLDTIKSNMEASFSSAASTNTVGGGKQSSSEWSWIRLIRGNGFLRLLHAWPVALGRGIPSAAVTLTTYDVITQYLIQQRSFNT